MLKTTASFAAGIVALGLACASGIGRTEAREGVPLKIGRDTVGFHVPVNLLGKTVYGREPDEHFVFMVEDALETLKQEKNILVLSVSKLKNGVALMADGRKGEKVRILAFDENELDVNSSSPLARANISIILLTIAHEIGHHVCGHIAGRSGPPWEQELEADQVAGAILVQSLWRSYWKGGGDKELELDDFLDAGRRVLGDETGSPTHPPLAKRLAAIQSGWTNETGKAALGSCAAKMQFVPARRTK